VTSDPERVKRLTTASSFCLFDNRLRSSGNGSIIWGLLNLAIGAVAISARGPWGIVSLLLGLALIIAGIYERKVRDPNVIIVAASTLGVLALWNFALIGLAAAGVLHLVMGGKTLYWAIAQAAGAYATWKTYATYRTLRAEVDPVVVEQVRGYIDELKKAKPSQSLDLVEFDVNAGFVQGTNRYRLKPVEDLYLAARYRVQLGSMHLEEVTFVPRSEVLLTPVGGKWASKKLKATVQLGSHTLNKATITREMAVRINPVAETLVLGAT
jgi:hypothetical protein